VHHIVVAILIYYIDGDTEVSIYMQCKPQPICV